MSDVNRSIFIGSTQDAVTKIPLGGIDYADETVDALVSNNPTVFWTEKNPNGQTDLCFAMSDAVSYIIGEFVACGTSDAYKMQSRDFQNIGPTPKPPTRCPLCP